MPPRHPWQRAWVSWRGIFSAMLESSEKVAVRAKPLDSRTFLEAIALRKCVEAVYNRMTVTLAPYILYTRHDELFIDAVTVERNGQPPKELKIGTFKLAGLKTPKVVERSFEVMPVIDFTDSKYAGVTLFAAES